MSARLVHSPLTRLALRDIPTVVDDVHLIALFETLFHLVELELSYSLAERAGDLFTDALLTRLCAQKTVPCVMPKLRRISVGDLSQSSLDLLLDVLESRTSHEMECATLQSAQLHYQTSREFGAPTMLRVRALRDSGMGVEIQMDG